MSQAYTRAEFERRRSEAAAVIRKEVRLLALVAVIGGLSQLIFIRWAEGRYGPDGLLTVEAALFLVYMAVVAQCGKKLQGMSERVAAATGNCDQCGGQVVETALKEAEAGSRGA